MPAYQQITVTAPSRLHFGMFSFGNSKSTSQSDLTIQPFPADGHLRTGLGISSKVRQYGGVGVMIDQPAVEIKIKPASRFSTSGLLADRVNSFALKKFKALNLSEAIPIEIEVIKIPPQHTGLGIGTALGMSVSAGVDAWLGRKSGSPEEIALAVGRGARSAVGAYGFCSGGLVAEAGRTEHEMFSPLIAQVELPRAWRFVLIESTDQHGLAGKAESAAFKNLPATTEVMTEKMSQEALLELLPAAKAGCFEQFAESLYRFGYMSGENFASVQGGPYAGEVLAEIVQTIRDYGIAGVGQSSWGPTLFAVTPSESAATDLKSHLERELDLKSHTISITTVNRSGAAIACT